MGILTPFIVAVFYLAVVLMDIAVAFLVVRILCRRFPARLLLAFDRVGTPLVKEITDRMRGPLERLCGRPVTDPFVLGASLICFLFARTTAVLIVRGLTALR